MRKLGFAHLVATVVGIGLLALLIAAPNADAGSRNAGCGGANQRPCNFWEAFPSCDGNLKEDFILHRCVAPPSSGGGSSGTGPAQCGNEGQRPCTIFEAFPSCDAGLVENFLDNKCLKPGAGSTIADVSDSFVLPNCADVFQAASIFSVHPGSDLNQNPALSTILSKLRGGVGTNLNALYNYKLGPGALADFVWGATIPKDTLATPLRVVGALTYYATLYCGLTLERDLALQAELALQENFDSVKENVTEVKASVADVKALNTTITNDVATLATKVTGDVASLTAKITTDVAALSAADAAIQNALGGLATVLTTLDADTKQRLTLLEAQLAEVIRLLNTPPGHRGHHAHHGHSNH
jgi:hypothetical protein